MLNTLPLSESEKNVLFDTHTKECFNAYAHHIENLIGTVKIPVGIAGPLLIQGQYAKGEFVIPLATSEGALVASYNRGMKVIKAALGCHTAVTSDAMTRSPVFVFDTLENAIDASHWIQDRFEKLQTIVSLQSRYAILKSIDPLLHGNLLFFVFSFQTGDAAGQNMVTIATQAICNYIVSECPVMIKEHYVESNLCGDKKATNLSFQRGRGKSVTAHVNIPCTVFEKVTGCSVEKVKNYYDHAGKLGAALSGSMGAQAHVANALAALYLACGQDIACVAESAVGVCSVLQFNEHSLDFSLTLPNVIVGTVGGGTSLPSASTCLNIIGVKGEGQAKAFAEIVAATALAGEISILAAIAQGHFVKAHASLGRKPKAVPSF